MAYTEFYCDATNGLNTNAGDLTANGVVTSTNGAWSTVTNIFTATGGTPFSGVVAGDFCALMADGGTVAAYIARVTAVGGGGLTLTLSATAKSGTAPTTAGTGITATTGGAWKGPNAAVNFPFGFVQSTMTNASGNPYRINLKNNAQYNITAGLSHSNSGAGCFEGYTTTAGDGGRATIDGGTSGASYVLLTVGNILLTFRNLIFANNGATGSANGITDNSSRNYYQGITVHDVRGIGMSIGASNLIRCEAYLCNTSNSTTSIITISGKAEYCIAHDNAGSNSNGFSIVGGACLNCISDTNGGNGFIASTGSLLSGCIGHNNTSAGVLLNAGNSSTYLQNCIFTSNATYGINLSGATNVATVVNCAFFNNTSGQTNGLNATEVTGSITLTGNPFTDAANGNFALNNTAGAGAACRGAGIGTFTQTASQYSATTTSYPDVGAAQHQETPNTNPVGKNVVITNIGTY